MYSIQYYRKNLSTLYCVNNNNNNNNTTDDIGYLSLLSLLSFFFSLFVVDYSISCLKSC